MSVEDTLQTIHRIQDLGFKKVKIAVVDMDGVLRGKYIDINKLKSIADSGFGFCSVIFGWDSSDVCYDNTSYTGWHNGYPDSHAQIDFKTLRHIPWDQKVPFFLADFVNSTGKPLEICPRQILKRVIRELEQEGYHATVGCEYEWFNFKETASSLAQKGFQKLETLTPGMFGYSVLRASSQSAFLNDIMDQLGEFDIPLEGLHTETGPGVYEAAITYSDPLVAADRAVLFKTSVKEIAQHHDIVASFMARWNQTLPGCSGHIHESLYGLHGETVLHDGTKKDSMSDIFRMFLAGQIRCLPEILPMFAPTINSYKRLVEGFWAPTRATWGVDNRTCAYRVLNPSPKSTRVEVRVPGSDSNPYLAVAASLASGLYGIRHGLSLDQESIKGNGYQDRTATKLASNLKEAALIFQQSSIARELFGECFVEHFAATRLWEWQQYQQSISDWELKRYFEII